MSDPKPDSPPDSTQPDGSPVENPSGAADNSGGIAANEVDPDLRLIDPTGSE
jgi:hypothetical protein